jgi:tRNA/tmRNA/rRNA uracil-C5-methylase (TrmA/RlmC/RlmD family)
MILMDFTYFYEVKYTLFLILFVVLSKATFSQENQTQTLLKVKALQEKKAEYHRRTNGESDGYRLKIHFSADRTKAEEVKARFDNKHADMITYIDYQLPNFVIVVGDYRTKLEAFDALKKIKEDYPYAFIVKSRVKPMKLN